MASARISPIYEWLVDGAPGARGPEQVVLRMARELAAAGIPVVRVAAFVRTLHPHIMGRAFYWSSERDAVDVREAPYALLTSPTFLDSPVGRVFATGEVLRRRLLVDPLDFPDTRELHALGCTDYVVLPLRFLDGQVHAITMATDSPAGFTDADVDDLRALARPLARIAEILALRRTATNLLSAYVGRDAGERILSGRVQRGDTETLRCVVWFSDLRGFTRLSAERQPVDIISLLNRVFDCQVPAVEQGGGEVLKFMGDGMLAVFPVLDDPALVARRALAAARAAFAALDADNAAHPDEPLAFGVALHLGDVAYGNIGGVGRLDFTCIGPAVNLAARLEGLNAVLGRRLVVSADVAPLLGDDVVSLGHFVLKGVPGEPEVFAPV